jgi:CARDB
MQTRSLLLTGLALIGMVALFSSLSGPANMQDLPTGPRPTPPAAALPPDYVPSSPAEPDALPDLIVVSLLLSDPDPYVNKPVTIFVTIQNVGTQDVEPGNNFFVDFYVNPPTDDLRGLRGDVYWPVQGYRMKVGQTATFTTTMSFPDTMAYNLWAQVDTPEYPCCPIGNVLESDEDNNILGPEYAQVHTHYAWVQKDHTDFFSNMASTLDVVPVAGTVGIITNTPGLVINGDSALALGIFEEPPKNSWGASSNTDDYNMMNPDSQMNAVTTNDQKNVSVHAQTVLPDTELVVGVWEDGRNGAAYGKDIFLRWSQDGGENWTANDIKVNDVSSINDQKHPAVAVAPDGKIVVAWQDHRESSFDIYVQVFAYSGGTWHRCHSNGDCSTDCDPTIQACNFRVDTDANARDQILPDISVSKQGDFYLAWQDQRNGNDDIFAVRSYTSMTDCPTNREGLGFAPHTQVQELQGVAPEQTYLCWGDDTRIDDDASTTKQASPSISAIDGVKIIDILYVIIPPIFPGDPPTLVVTEVVSAPTTYIVATWEDWREGDADIYLTYSDDEGETFGLDERLNNDKPANSTNDIDQLQPAVAINQWMKSLPFTKDTPYGPAEGQAEVPVTSMHIVWQDFRHSMNVALDDNPDIFYCRVTAQPDQYFPWPILLVNEGQQQANQNDERAWQTGPVWQGEPDVAANSSAEFLADAEGYNAFVAWADGRNYGAGDFENTDIYFRLFSNVGAPTDFIGGNDLMLNDNARLHDFTVANYAPYRRDMPPHAHQRAPSIASTLIATWPTIFGGYVYVGWDDDRITDPFYDRNVYLARTNMLFGGHYRIFDVSGCPVTPPGSPPGQCERYASGAFISEIFDSISTKTKWYMVDWHATTDNGTYITLQTRMGNTREAVLASDWYPKRFPYPDDAISVGAPLQGYDAPGQHIEDAAGHTCPDNCPTARYIQYRVNFWARNASPNPNAVQLFTPFLFDVILHYERHMIFLPIIFDRY